MRAVRPLRGTRALSALLFLPLVASTAVAQFDDEFDDEFSEPAAEPAPAASGGGFDDEFDDPAPAPTAGTLEDDLADASDDGASDDETPPADTADEPEGELTLRERLFATSYNTYMGPTGGLHVVDAGGGAVGSFRAQLALDFFFSNGFINPSDDAKHIGGSLSLSWTVAEFAEIWASIQSYANSNETGDPSLFQVLGDTQLGFKGFYRVLPFFTVGGDLSLSLLNTVGDIGVVFKSTSVGLRANATLDLRGLSSAVPFIARFNFQYYFDNSSNLIDDVEDQRYANLEAPEARENEFRHLVTDVERFGLQINRTDFINIGLGFEAPLRVADNFYLHPLLEWNWGIPVNRQGYNCLYIPADDGSGDPAEGQDGCLDRQGVGSFPMNLTLGLRVAPPVKGLSFLLAADIGLTGKKDFVRELSPNAPYNLYLGLSYAYDTTPPPPPEPTVREVERRVEVQLPPPVMGRIRGTVREQGAGTPVAGAIIAFPGRDLTALSASDAGVFTTYLLEPGEVQLAISHPEYEDGACAATIPSERPGAAAEAPADPDAEFDDPAPASAAAGSSEHLIEVVCELVARPRLGNLRGRVVSGDDGAGVVGATIQITGPQTRQSTSTADGTFNVQGLAPGSYTIRVDSDAFLIKMETVEVRPREDSTPTITMVPRPRQALVVVRSREIQIRRQINFATNSADILPSSTPLMTEIADVFIRNPQIVKVEIQGHTDNTGPDQRNRELSQQRADAVRQWLVDHGVAATRLEARGYGPDRPLVPNITPANRARNRRVQFVIQEQGE
ncbi:MAG: OmpA family protein [Sandaracinus sp.]|nr:OmpA family protein [Sandaracinus sp.]MCB9624781.1 OmpA family protein [Sandaracinus sp.]